MKRTVVRVVVILSLVAIAIPATALPASAKRKTPQFPTTPDNYLPATVGGLTVILRGGTCPADTFNAIDATINRPPEGQALALGGVCFQPHPGVVVFPLLNVLNPAQLASQEAKNAADTTTTKSPVVTGKNVSGIKVEIDQYTHTLTEPIAGQTMTTNFVAFGTPVKGKIVIQATAPDEATALAELQAMLQAAQGEVPRLVTTSPTATRNTPQDPNDPEAFFKALPGIKYGPPYDASTREALDVQAGRNATKSATGEVAAVTIVTCPTAVQPCAATSTAFTPSTLAGQPVNTYTLNDHAGVVWWPAPMAVIVVGQPSEFVNELMASLIKANTKDKPRAPRKP